MFFNLKWLDEGQQIHHGAVVLLVLLMVIFCGSLGYAAWSGEAREWLGTIDGLMATMF